MEDKNRNPWLVGLTTSAIGSIAVSLLDFSINNKIEWYWPIITLTTIASIFLFIYNEHLRKYNKYLSKEIETSNIIFLPYKEFPVKEIVRDYDINRAKVKDDYFECSQDMSTSYMALWGPYITLEKGFYKVAFTLKIDEVKNKDRHICTIEVNSRQSRKTWTTRPLIQEEFKLGDTYQDFSLYFDLEDFSKEDNWEFRLSIAQGYDEPRRIMLKKITVYKK